MPVGLAAGLYFNATTFAGRHSRRRSLAEPHRGVAATSGSAISRACHTFTRLSFSGNAQTPVWSADGRTIYYVVTEPSGRKTTVMRKPADGSREAEPIVALEFRTYLKDVTAG